MFEPHDEVCRVLDELRRGATPPEIPEEPQLAPETLLEENRDRLAWLEQLLAEMPAGEQRPIALSVAAKAARTAVPRFTEQAADEAAAYVEGYPMPGLPLGDVGDRAARWLAVRYGGTGVRAEIRSRLAALAEAAREEVPAAAAALAALAGEPASADPARDELWLELVRTVVVQR